MLGSHPVTPGEATLRRGCQERRERGREVPVRLFSDRLPSHPGASCACVPDSSSCDLSMTPRGSTVLSALCRGDAQAP